MGERGVYIGIYRSAWQHYKWKLPFVKWWRLESRNHHQPRAAAGEQTPSPASSRPRRSGAAPDACRPSWRINEAREAGKSFFLFARRLAEPTAERGGSRQGSDEGAAEQGVGLNGGGGYRLGVGSEPAATTERSRERPLTTDDTERQPAQAAFSDSGSGGAASGGAEGTPARPHTSTPAHTPA
jgi:hypothetical protein